MAKLSQSQPEDRQDCTGTMMEHFKIVKNIILRDEPGALMMMSGNRTANAKEQSND